MQSLEKTPHSTKPPSATASAYLSNGVSKAKVVLPNVRKLFIPDAGFTIYDADLSGADAQVVAWESDDEDLKHAFKTGLKIHIKNTRDVFPDKVKGWTDDAIKATDTLGGIYNDCKKGVHATNYGGTARTLAQVLGWTVHEAERFQSRWFTLHPDIKKNFHSRVQKSLQQNRTVRNKFGFHIVYFDRIDAVFGQALAWIPQSTVALTTYLGCFQLEAKYPQCQVLLQDHDNLVFQFPSNNKPLARDIKAALAVSIPYDDPLTIPWGLASSEKSWGDCEEIK